MLTLILLMAVLCGRGQNAINLGYCAGEVSGEGALTVEGKTWVSGAIYLPATMLQTYNGATITAIRAGLASKVNIDTVRVWVRGQLDGENLAVGTITIKTEPKIKKGWNEVPLEQPIAVDATEGLYIGYSYHQKAATGAFSAVGSQLPNAFFAQLSPDDEWQDMSSLGILSIEATLEDVSAPDYEVGITSAKAAPWSDAGTYQLTVGISNNGQKDITGLTLLTQYANTNEAFTEHFELPLAAGESSTLTYTIVKRDRDEAGDIIVSIASIDDGEDAFDGNNTMTARFAYQRKVLIEEYTTERCSNCPRVAGWLHNIMNTREYRDNVIAVCHHAGYGTDWMTQQCDLDLMNFFNVGYAPAMMWDRAPLFNSGTTIHICPEYSEITESIEKRLAEEPHAVLSFTKDFNEDTGVLNINIIGERNAVFTNNPVRLIVYVLENNIPDAKQASGGDDYMQQHVIRAYNDNTWGDEIAWDVNSFSMDYTFQIDSSWNRDNLEVVGIICSYNSSNKFDCVIENHCCPLKIAKRSLI